jgi:prepilin-type N-terminal cleavage/methylation domain-containing protein
MLRAYAEYDKPMNEVTQSQRGFTLIELLVAMAVFSFMLLMIVVGFTNVVRLHNEALASNATQDSSRSAMNEVVRSIRDSSSMKSYTAGPTGSLCLAISGGLIRYYYLDPAAPVAGTATVLMRADGTSCAPSATAVPVTANNVTVTNFSPEPESVAVPPATIKSPIKITLTVASANGTADGAGQCTTNYADRSFCATSTLISGGMPR